MGSKTIMFLGVLLSALYLYFCISKYAVATPVATIVDEVKPVEQVEVVAPVAETKVAKEVKTEVVVDDKIERLSTPAFGFMAGEKNQIVALMSNNDKDSELSKRIEALCKKRECSKDMRYEKDIKDAVWQNEIVKIIELLTDGSIESGSLFIESNVLKIEGKVKDEKAQQRLNDILNSVKSDTFKVENHLRFSGIVEKKKPEVKAELPKKEATPINVEPVVKNIEPVKKEIIVEKVEPEIIKEVVIEEKKIIPVVKKATPKPIKKVVSKPVAVPVPVMETTLDAEARVRAILGEIKESKAVVGVVAEPHMETTVE